MWYDMMVYDRLYMLLRHLRCFPIILTWIYTLDLLVRSRSYTAVEMAKTWHEPLTAHAAFSHAFIPFSLFKFQIKCISYAHNVRVVKFDVKFNTINVNANLMPFNCMNWFIHCIFGLIDLYSIMVFHVDWNRKLVQFVSDTLPKTIPYWSYNMKQIV